MRKDFALPEQDHVFLMSKEWIWETINDGGLQWVLIKKFTVPNGYNVSAVQVAIMIPPGYPTSQLDMVYFFPALSLSNNKGIGALSFHPIDGKPFQRWSRHRTPQNPWRPGIDDLSGHITLIDFWLERELKK
jgi:hypothetical protein